MLYITHLVGQIERARRQLLKTKTFVAIANATIIHILNSYYNFFLIYNQTKEIIIKQ